jgi:protein-S-isoprenylcysteine O-methyltransferase Ste14
MRRWFWIAFGGFAQLLFFAVTVPQLFLLLYRGSGDLLGLGPASWGRVEPAAPVWGFLLNSVLLVQFGVWHSLFLLPATRRRLERWVPSALYGSLYTVVVTASLLPVCWLWQPLPGVIYAAEGWAAWALLGAFLASWGLMFYSMSRTGLGWQTGLTPWWAYVRGVEPPPRRFATTGLYGWLRHPIYLSFLCLIWVTPRMTADHLLLACVWTAYVYVGSVLKDRRLLYFLGERYRAYMERVPGYPLLPWGPLARLAPSPRHDVVAAGVRVK